MTPKNQDGAATALSPGMLQEIEKGMKPINRNEATIYRGNERRPIFSVRSPAYAVASVKAIELIGNCSEQCKLESRTPQALQAWDSAVPGYILFTPVEIYDPTKQDQYELSWHRGNRVAFINLIEILQPRNLEVPKGYVAEMPVTVQKLSTGVPFIFLHTGEATLRPERTNEEAELLQEAAGEVAAAEETE